jgi:hypothetical protein
MNRLPYDLQHLIWEYTQDPDSLIISHGRKMVINRCSNRLKDIGGIIMMKHFYPLYNHNTITLLLHRRLYHWGKEHYGSRFLYQLI